jgi:hypothetical protein
VGVKVVHHKNPTCVRISSHGPGYMVSKILFRPGIAHGGNDGFSRHYVEVPDQTLRTVATIFVLQSLRLSSAHGLTRRNSLQGLDARHLIHAYRVLAFFLETFRCCQVTLTDCFHFTLKLLRIVDFRVQPILDAMGFLVALI